MFRSLFGNIRSRIQRGYQRAIDGWAWILKQTKAIQWAIIADLVFVFVGITLTMISESNKPARYTFIPVMLLAAYIVRKLVLPIWFAELTLVAYRRITDMLPEGMREYLRRDTKHHTGVELHDIHRDPIWHDKSLGGHIFHIHGIVWMWLHVVLLGCGLYPVWKYEFLSVIVMSTLFILFFVWTEDFVDVKRWRTRLAWVVGFHVTPWLLLMIFATILPGSFENFKAKYDYYNAKKQAEADSIIVQRKDDKAFLAGLYEEDSKYRTLYRKHLRDANGRNNQFDRDWTATDSSDWAIITAQIEEIQESNLPMTSIITSPFIFHPRLALPAGLLLGLVGIVAWIWTK